VRLRRVYVLFGLAVTVVAVALAWSYFPVSYRRVPARVPDRVPGGLYARQNIVRNAPWVAGPILRDVALVQFHLGTSQEARQAAVDRVGGRVVGGARVFGDDGIYLVRVPSEPGACALGRALSVLNRMPQVAAASPEMLWTDGPDPLPTEPPPDLGVEDAGIKCGLFFSVQDSLDAEVELARLRARLRADTLLRSRAGARP
jgi:hypothetical protein